MPTEKRQRKKQGREARLAELRAAEAKARLRKRIIGAVVVAALVVGAALLFSRGEDGERVTTKGTSTTTTATKQSTSTTPATDGRASTVPASAEGCPPAGGTPEPRKDFPSAPPVCIDAKKVYTAQVKTDIGAFTLDLDAAKAPKTVNNFVFLARNHFYDGVPFHRVIPGFVVQGGDGEKGDGSGGPGYEIDDELPKAGAYKVGSVAMANSGPDTNGSQFFVVTGAQGAGLPPSYSLFGEVTDGLDVVKAIEADGTASGTPKVTHKITGVTISEKNG